MKLKPISIEEFEDAVQLIYRYQQQLQTIIINTQEIEKKILEPLPKMGDIIEITEARGNSKYFQVAAVHRVVDSKYINIHTRNPFQSIRVAHGKLFKTNLYQYKIIK